MESSAAHLPVTTDINVLIDHAGWARNVDSMQCTELTGRGQENVQEGAL